MNSKIIQIKALLGLCFSLIIVGCGGSSSSDSSIVTQVNAAGTGSTLQVKLVDASGVIVKANAIDINSSGAFVQATVRDISGVPIPNLAVTFSTSPVYGSFINGTTAVIGSTVTGTYTVSQIKGISDTTGAVKVQLQGRALGTDAVTAETKVGSTTVTTSMPYQITSTTGSSSISTSNGRIKQGSMSVSASIPYVEGFDVDGASTEFTVRATDRLGNPIASGTVVRFATSHGLIGSFLSSTGGTTITDSSGSCVMDAQSLCKVKLISSGPRPPNGKVTVLAYADGEEQFTKTTGDKSSIWVAGDSFSDMGQAYLDRNGNGVYDIGIDDPIGSRPGNSLCPGTPLAIADTCDGTWSPLILARQRFEVIWATSAAKITQVGARTSTSFGFTILDLNGNPMTTGNTVLAEIISTNMTTTTTSTTGVATSTVVPNDCKLLTTNVVDVPTGLWSVLLDGSVGCPTAAIRVTVTSPTVTPSAPSGTKTIKIFN